MSLIEIDKRYSGLADQNCCLSCGGAIEYSKVQNGETCVDLGSGRGTDAMRLAEEVGEDGMVYGIDISEGMLSKAKNTAEKLGIQNLKFLKSDLEQLPLEDNIVDLVISNCTINHATDKQKVWLEIFRVLKSGGRFVISDIYASKPVPEKYRTNPKAIAECWGGSITKMQYMEQLKIAGFEKVEIIEESKPYLKGEIEISNFTIKGFKHKLCSCNK